ncbi:hypothetical protein ABKA04_006185 [Annulohypoxylon sp. FPYF3050]
MVSPTAQAENAGEGPSNRSIARTMTLGDVTRAPSVIPPPVIVLDSMHQAGQRDEIIDPKEDLWLTSADGRFNSPIIPLRVGTAPDCQTFYVHKSVLIKAEFFKKALCGEFMESEAQAMELPEEDPAIFHFVVAFLYENKYVPIKAAATVLIPDDKREHPKRFFYRPQPKTAREETKTRNPSLGEGKTETPRNTSSWMWLSTMFDERWSALLELQYNLLTLFIEVAPRLPPPPPGPMPMQMGPGVVVMNVDPPRQRNNNRRRRPNRPPPAANGGNTNASNDNTNNNNPNSNTNNNNSNNPNEEIRIQGQDLRTWLLTYELNIDVYICANKFLLDDFKSAIARSCIDMLETAGSDAAHIEVLYLCRKLYEGLPESDRLLRMIFARVGFLNTHLWRRAHDQTAEFFHAHPEVGALMFKETLGRREEEHGDLPAMERPVFPTGGVPPFGPGDPRGFIRRQGWRELY